MYLVRDIFHLKFGHYREVKAQLDEAMTSHLLPQEPGSRVLTDFTGQAYRLIFEQPVASLAEYEKSLQQELSHPDWKGWYDQFKQHVESSEREILKVVASIS
jgi:hypothetical protein